MTLQPQNATQRSSLALRGLPLFNGLSEARLVHLAQQCRWLNLAAHQPVMMRSESRDDVYFLVMGRLRVTSYSADGRQVSFRDSAPGDWFGEIAAIDGAPRTADVLTLEPCTVASLDGADFLHLMRHEPLVNERVILHLTRLVRQLSQRVIELSTLSVRDRLQAELLRMTLFANVSGNAARLEPAPTHEALASRISTSREQVTRELAALSNEGMLIKQSSAMLLTDVARLRKAVADSERCMTEHKGRLAP